MKNIHFRLGLVVALIAFLSFGFSHKFTPDTSPGKAKVTVTQNVVDHQIQSVVADQNLAVANAPSTLYQSERFVSLRSEDVGLSPQFYGFRNRVNKQHRYTTGSKRNYMDPLIRPYQTLRV